jgi:putative Mg2+ transporter-C (MgtC) family protein
MLTTIEVAARLGAAVGLGAILGLNRDLRHKPAGLGTHMMVALGSALVLVVADLIAGDGPNRADALARVVQGVVSGIGFLGAGVIVRSHQGRDVHGLTTASSVWVTSVLGLACGVGAWVPALMAGLIAWLVLSIGKPIENALHLIIRGRPAKLGKPGSPHEDP